MKLVKKFTSLMLALAMVLTMSVSVFAAQEGNLRNGSITINDAVPGQTYTIYQILYLETYDSGKGAYLYKANSAWENWLKSEDGGGKYVDIDDQGYVTWNEGADAADFAKAALAYAQTNKLANDGVQEAPAADEGKEYSTVTFNNLKLGYYLVDSSLGALCSLDTTNPDATIEEKNTETTTEKEVQEDSDGSWGDENTAQIGDTVEFRTTIHAKAGAQNYVLHDQMSNGLTLNPDSIKVYVGSVAAGNELGADNYTVKTTGLTDGCDFEIVFKQSYLDTISKDVDLVVTYSAVLNEQAAVSPDANTNGTDLEYGENNRTTWDETKTYTFEFDIVKTDSDKKLLDGAEFELYDAQTGGNKIPLVKVEDGVYRLATDEESEDPNFKSAVIVAKNGQATVKGLDADTSYWLEETKAPDGYNKLDSRVEVKMEEGNLSASIENGTWTEGGVHIINKTGSELPSTGGIGTTIFYVIGGILAAGAGVLLVIKTRKRTSRG